MCIRDRITPEQIKELLTSVMSDFQSWLTEQGANPGAEEFGMYFQQYLQTGRANAIVNKWANEIFGDIDFIGPFIYNCIGTPGL